MADHADDDLLDVTELAKHLRSNRRTIYRLVAKRAIPEPIRIGGMHRWEWKTIREWQRALSILRQLGVTIETDLGQEIPDGVDSETALPDPEKPASKPAKRG